MPSRCKQLELSFTIMRVLYLTMNPHRTSTTVPLEGWIRSLRDKGLQPVVASDRLGAFHEWAQTEGIPSYHVPLPFPNKVWPWKFLSSLIQLRRLVARHRIELIHCNEQDIYPMGQYLARWCSLPAVVSIHFTMDRGFCEWAFGQARSPRRMFFISQGSLDACRPGVTGVVPESAWRLLYNGLDVDKFQPDAALRQRFRCEHHLESNLVLGVACALRSRKQLEHLFEAASRLKDPQLKVVVAGGAPRVRIVEEQDYPEAIIARGKELLGDRFLHLGRLNELRGFYNGLDLFVNTSREEGCSISVLESLACGCPVVGYPSTSVHEQVLPDGGEIVEQDQIDQLTDALERLLRDPTQLAVLRQSARQRAEKYFDIRKLSLQLWDEYQNLRN
jgi:glycosyltransferase involved in cell wall biosynthesis